MPPTAFIQQHEVKLYYTGSEKMVLEKRHEGSHMMERRNSMAPTDDELLRLALDEEPLPHAMKEYLEQCATSRQQFALYKRTHSYLLSKLYRHQCPTATRLNLYCAGRLSGDEEKCITHHMAACPLCTDEAVMICRVLADFEPFPDMHSR